MCRDAAGELAATRHATATKGMTVEITIGVQHLTRELVVETDLTADEASAAVAAALSGGSTLELKDSRGRRIVVPTASIGYIEIGTEASRPVGFGNVS